MTRLRPYSTRRIARNIEANPWRTLLRMRGQCEWCLSDRNGLQVHEIARGQHRPEALDKPFATILLCAACHRDLHELPAPHAVCIGLALLRYNRPDDYHLEHYYRLTNRRWPSEELVESWWRRILMGKTQSSF